MKRTGLVTGVLAGLGVVGHREFLGESGYGQCTSRRGNGHRAATDPRLK